MTIDGGPQPLEDITFLSLDRWRLVQGSQRVEEEQ